MLLDAGASLEPRDPDGTALDNARKQGKKEVAQMIVEAASARAVAEGLSVSEDVGTPRDGSAQDATDAWIAAKQEEEREREEARQAAAEAKAARSAKLEASTFAKIPGGREETRKGVRVQKVEAMLSKLGTVEQEQQWAAEAAERAREK
eukprot:2060008-Prymnesium_polylepis.1